MNANEMQKMLDNERGAIQFAEAFSKDAFASLATVASEAQARVARDGSFENIVAQLKRVSKETRDIRNALKEANAIRACKKAASRAIDAAAKRALGLSANASKREVLQAESAQAQSNALAEAKRK